MKALAEDVHQMVVTVLVGGLPVVGYVVAPVLFHTLNRSLAGMLAEKLFGIMVFVGIACGVYLLIFHASRVRLTCLKKAVFVS